MAHFAEIDDSNVVLRVLVIPDEQESRGQDYLAKDLGLGGTWVQTSDNSSFRKQYCSPGYYYNAEADIFVSPQPFPSWTLDENYDWQPPIPYPSDGESWSWDEEALSWVAIEMPE